MAGPFESILNNMRESFADGGSVIAKRGLVDGPGGYSGRKPLPILPKHRRIALKVYKKPFEELSQRIKGSIRDNTITEKSIPLGTNEERKQKCVCTVCSMASVVVKLEKRGVCTLCSIAPALVK